MDFLRKIIFILILFTGWSATAQQEETFNIFERSYLLENEGEYTKAIQALKTIYDEDSYEVNLRLGWLHYLSGLFSEAVPYYQRCITLRPLSIEARLGIALPVASMGNWSQVEKYYREILEMDPENSWVNYRMALLYYGREDYQTAYKYIEKVVNHYPFDYDSVVLMAWINYRMGKTREARVLFTKSLLMRPGDESATKGLELLGTN
jgi:tetratricopeptide (TPR) repeat protein